MNACEEYADVIDDYVDETLDPEGRRVVEAHLAECATCRTLVHDLQQLRRTARALDAPAPPPRVWAAIANQIEADRAAARPQRIRRADRMRSSWLIGLAAAAAVALVVITASVVRLMERPRATPATTTTAAAAPAKAGTTAAATPESVAGELQQAEAHYEKAIDGLQQIARAGQGSLDPKVAAALQQNLTVIDQAIAESRAALQAQPTSEPARASLLDAFRTKVGLLEDTIALINEMRKGNSAGAARIVNGLKQS